MEMDPLAVVLPQYALEEALAEHEARDAEQGTQRSTESSTYQVTRYTLVVDRPYEEFRRRFEAAVPAFDSQGLKEFVDRKASWDQVVANADATALLGFFMTAKLDVGAAMALNGNTTKCCTYAIGNNVVGERMFRVDPAAMLYVPLRVVLFEQRGGPTTFVIERPSAALQSLGSPQIDTVATELDRKLVTLLRHLEMPVPADLVNSSAIS